MKSKQILLTESKITELVERNEHNDFPTVKFSFVSDHCGFRKGCLHTLMSTSSAGKSTLVRSLVRQTLLNNKVTYYSTEESLENAQLFMSQGYTNVRKLALNVAFLHEDSFLAEIEDTDYSKWIDGMFKEAIAFGSDLLIIDNISTSDYYDGKLKAQGTIVNKIGRLARAANIAVLIVIHTATGVTQDSGKLLGPDDVRGARTISNKSEYFYTLQRFTQDQEGNDKPRVFTFITVNKARMHTVSNQIYQLRYHVDKNQFIDDRLIPFADFDRAFSCRNRLGMTKKKGG